MDFVNCDGFECEPADPISPPIPSPVVTESAEEAWKRGFIAGDTDAAADLGATLYGTTVPPYVAPLPVSAEED